MIKAKYSASLPMQMLNMQLSDNNNTWRSVNQ